MLGKTIAAIATPPANGGIGIIRISGANALVLLQKMFWPVGVASAGFLHGTAENSCSKNEQHLFQPEPRRLYLGQVKDNNGGILDQAMAVYMPAPHSYTGEDVVEIQCHGGYLVCHEILAAVVQAGAQLAEPGEFTSRAFINGKISLDQAEAVVDIIEAKSAEALKISERQLAGSLQQQLAGMADALLDILAQLELAVDYPEETDEPILQQQILQQLDAAQQNVQKLLAQTKTGRYYREGALTAIVGPTNAGKSTLLNTLLQVQRAIVTPIPGTTRDTVEEYYLLDGLPLRLVDTAGIRETDDLVEQAGIERSKQALAAADLVLLTLDCSQPIEEFWLNLLQQQAQTENKIMLLLNKIDLLPAEDLASSQNLAKIYQICADYATPLLQLSAKDGLGLTELKQAIKQMLMANQSGGEPMAALLNDRHKAALLAADAALNSAAEAVLLAFDAAMLSIDVQTAWQALAEISGQAASEAIIERVFARFCLGK